jgi:uncharacterized Fe-S cluster-containing radical SAM superfamily protein
LVHFLRGGITQNIFVSKAVGVYMDGLGLDRDMARQIALGGNDPVVVAKILGKEAQETNRITGGDTKWYSRILIALRNRAHFMTILKDTDGVWWNYDSLLNAPDQINDIRQFIQDNPGRTYFVAR